MNNYDRVNYTTTDGDFKYIGPDLKKSEDINKPSTTYWKDSWRRFKKNKAALSFLILLGVYLFFGLFGSFLSKYNYYEQHTQEIFLSPIKGFSKGYYLGTDSLGRDIYSRVIQGIKISLQLSIIVASICVIIGSIYGSISAYFGGIIDTIMVRIIEIVLSIPSMIYIILLMVV